MLTVQVVKRKKQLPRNPFDKFRGKPEVVLGSKDNNNVISMLKSLSQPGEPLVITGNTDNPFPPGFVNLIEPVCVDLDSNVTLSNISGDQID